MSFKRIQQQTHLIAGSTVLVLYDRFTTRFTIKKEDSDSIIFTCYLAFLPFRKAKIDINYHPFILKIRWFLLWRSTLINESGVVIKELLERRRRQSISLGIYLLLVSSIKFSVILLNHFS